MKTIVQLTVVIALAIIFTGCPQRQAQLNGTFVATIGGAQERMNAKFSWDIGVKRTEALLQVYNDKGELISQYTFHFPTGNVEVLNHKNGSIEYRVKTHPLENPKLEALLIVVENPVVSETTHFSAKGYKVIIEDHRFEKVQPIVHLYKEVYKPREEVPSKDIQEDFVKVKENIASFSGEYEQLAQK